MQNERIFCDRIVIFKGFPELVALLRSLFRLIKRGVVADGVDTGHKLMMVQRKEMVVLPPGLVT